jgi:hypothetical protein
MNKLTVAAMVLAAIGFASTSASAQSSTSPGTDDLILSFQVASSNTDFEVDLSPSATFNTAMAQSFNLSSSDLTTLTSNWASTASGTGVQWSVAGLRPAANTFNATSTTQPVTASPTTLGNAAGQIAGLGGGFQDGTNDGGNPPVPAVVSGATPNSALIGNNTAGNTASSIADSYTFLLTNGGTTTTYGLGNLSHLEQTGLGSDSLYAFIGSSATPKPNATLLGTFTLSDPAGGPLLTFTPVATPEPSAYAVGICAFLLFVVLKRRHSVV